MLTSLRRAYIEVLLTIFERIIMSRLAVFTVGSLAVLILVFVLIPDDPQMKMGNGQDVQHNHQKNYPGHAAHTGNHLPTKIPELLDVTKSKLSKQAKFRVSVISRIDPIVTNKMHSWIVEVKTPDDKPVQMAKLIISGGMPMHGHGLPTAPRVTKNLGDGKYLVEGVRFNMTGWWEMKVLIDDGQYKDNVTFNLVLK